jgi:hypothetical protein
MVTPALSSPLCLYVKQMRLVVQTTWPRSCHSGYDSQNRQSHQRPARDDAILGQEPEVELALR